MWGRYMEGEGKSRGAGKGQVEVYQPGRHKKRVVLDQVGGQAKLAGMFILRGEEELDLEIEINHVAPETTGRVWVRGVVTGEARVKVRGMIRIGEAAAEADSFLKINVLMLSPLARGDVRPELEILCNQVKASHAATIGKIDAEQMFYLESRGYSTREAERMVVEGWFSGILDEIEDREIRKRVERKLEARSGCKM